MGYTITQYDQLVAAISQGAMTVKYADKEVTYRSLNEMYRIKRDMEKDLGIGQGAKTTTKYAQFSKGLNNCQ